MRRSKLSLMLSNLEQGLQNLKNEIEQEILNKINNPEVKDILLRASEFVDKAQTKDELLFMYKSLSVRLYEAGMVCKEMRNPSLSAKFIRLSKVIQDILENYLLYEPRNVNKANLLSRIWPHNCRDIDGLKKVFREYVIENAVLLHCYDRLVVDFFNQFDMEIDGVSDLKSLQEVYENIQYAAEKTAMQYFTQGFYEYAWQYGIIGLVIEFMFSDFNHCLKKYKSTDIQTGWPTEPLRFRRHETKPYRLNYHCAKKSTKMYTNMERIVQKLREEFAKRIGQRVEQEFSGNEVEGIYNVLIEADLMLDKARTERELVAIYDMISERLRKVTHEYKSKLRLAYTLYRLSEIIHESIEEYLPHRVYEIDLVKLLWPHNCNNLKSMKDVFYEYILYNVSLLGSSQDLFIHTLELYDTEIAKANNLQQLREIYINIKADLKEYEDEAYRRGEYKSAWASGVIASVIGYMLSDFEHCLR